MKKRASKRKRKSHRHAPESLEGLRDRLVRELASRLAPALPPDADEATRRRWRARELVDRAWDSGDTRAAELAREALEIDPDCADAYLVLAERVAETPEELRDLYESALQASERAAGRSLSTVSAGEFFELGEASSYLRALLGLGRVLWILGDAGLAIARLEEALRLDPEDPVNARHFLFNYLALEGTPEAFGRLLKTYRDEDSAHWLYSRALWAFRRSGDGRKARGALLTAFGRSPRVVGYLLGRKQIPESPPSDFGYKSEEEAVHYAAFAEEAWQETPGALEWLAGCVPAAAPAGAVYQLRVLLLGSKPRIWRRLEVEADMTLEELHDVLQQVMGWGYDHLHQFEIAGVIYSPDPKTVTWTRAADELLVQLREALPHAKAAGVYEYDFGDGWAHELLVEKVAERKPEAE